MFSRNVLGKSKMSWWEYIFGYCIPTGFDTIRYSFLNWMDLVWFSDNQKHYALLKNDDAFECCRDHFWYDLAEEPYEKEFIENLYGMVDEIDRGEVELIPFTQEMFDNIEDLIGD